MNKVRKYLRFSVSDRIEHWLLTLSFGILGITGLVQKYPSIGLSEWSVGIMGGVENVRILHRLAAVIMMLEVIYHIGVVGYRVFVRRAKLSMLPGIPDLRAAIQTLLHNLGLRKDRPQQGRYTFEEKLEYWALIWGTLVMGITGFMLWNPIATTSFLPGEFVPAAKSAHSGEALLAVLAIIVWHFYHVHLRHFNKSIFSGYLTEEEMLDEHPLDLAEIKAGVLETPGATKAFARRRSGFLFAYGVLTVVMLFGIYLFVTIEQTAITTVPPPEQVAVFAPLTPTPLPTPLPTSASSTAVLPAGASDIPHPVVEREDCRSCHEIEGPQPLPADHGGRTNDFCQACHVPAPVPAILHPAEGRGPCLSCHDEGQVAQFSLSTHRGRDEVSCRTCHDPAGVTPLSISHSVEGQADCLTCHASQGFDPYPESHEGWGNQLCLLCHEAGAPPTEGEHSFPQDHNGTAKNCVLCHPGGDFAAYRCDTCHVPDGMNQVHEARGISEIEDKCVLCHPQGRKP